MNRLNRKFNMINATDKIGYEDSIQLFESNEHLTFFYSNINNSLVFASCQDFSTYFNVTFPEADNPFIDNQYTY